MTRTQRLRRVLLLCSQFARNMAYYRAGRRGRGVRIGTDFWRTVNGNNYDLCILEWCKLFADPKDSHHWQNVVSDTEAFGAELGQFLLPISSEEFKQYIRAMRHYRDKFVAHLDSDLIMQLPKLSTAKSAADFYYSHVIDSEASSLTVAAFPASLAEYYRECKIEALEVFELHAE